MIYILLPRLFRLVTHLTTGYKELVREEGIASKNYQEDKQLLTISLVCWWLKKGKRVDMGISGELPSSFLFIAVSPAWSPNG